MSLGNRLREERERLGFSQPKFGELMSTTKQTVFAWETDRTSPTAVQLAALAAAGVDVLYVLMGARGGVVLKPEEAALLDNFRHCPPEARDAIKATSDLLAQSKVKKKAS